MKDGNKFFLQKLLITIKVTIHFSFLCPTRCLFVGQWMVDSTLCFNSVEHIWLKKPSAPHKSKSMFRSNICDALIEHKHFHKCCTNSSDLCFPYEQWMFRFSKWNKNDMIQPQTWINQQNLSYHSTENKNKSAKAERSTDKQDRIKL